MDSMFELCWFCECTSRDNWYWVTDFTPLVPSALFI
jgi:hypothetical protein